MRSGADAALLTALLAEEARPVVFIDCQFTTPVRRTSLDIDYYFGGDKYEAGGVQIGAITNSVGMLVDRTQIKIANADRAIGTILLSNNEVGKTIIAYLAGIDDDGTLIGSVPLYRGELSFYELAYVVTLHVVNELVRWRKKCARRSQSSCPWPFQGNECGYSGDGTWCNQTYDRCTVLGNTDNFGGNRFLPALMQKRIWWGRVLS